MIPAIAIVGLACRYPDAISPGELWENVLASRRAFRRLPPERLSLADYHSPDRSESDRIYSTQAAVLEGYEFDRLRFRVTGTSFRSADLAHWLALDVASQALADAGFPDGEGLPRQEVGVVVGNTLTGELSRANSLRLRWPYVRRVVGAALAESGWDETERAGFLGRLEDDFKRPFAPMTEESLAGGLSNTIAGRIANHFDLGGGGFTVDGACASSLLAVCQACSGLAAGDFAVALAGGVDLSIDPFELVGFARTGALTPDEMRIYDRRSQGFIPGEGCGFAVLMREDEARARGLRIYSLIRGWGVSSDGAGGLTRPEADGQLAAFRRAYARAGFGPERVGLFEGHGTGTAVGDAIELEVLTRARQMAAAVIGTDLPPVAVGSIKANVGHTKAAAGIAALIKATLAVHHQVLPPTTGCEDPHPLLAAAEPDQPAPALRALGQGEIWPAELPLVAGVSAMGFGGINTHLVIEGAAERRRTRLDRREERVLGSRQDVELFLLAASTREALAAEVARLERVAARVSVAELADLAATLARGLSHGRVRAAVLAARPAELAARLARLRAALEGPEGEAPRLDPRQGVFLGSGATPPRIGFLFPGQAAPANLGGGLWTRRFPVVRELYERMGLPKTGDGVETDVAQPAIATASLAGLSLLAHLGIEGEVAIGHSLGELCALCWAGSLDETALLRLAKARGEVMARLGEASGAMAGIAASAAEVAALVATESADGGSLVLAGYNSPRQTVISGEASAIERAISRARGRGWTATRLKVSHAFHSPLVAAVGAGLAEALAGERFGGLTKNVVSTITGEPLPAAGDGLSALVIRQVTSPVLFAPAFERVADQMDLWIEVGPGSVLSGLVEDFGPFPAVALDAGGASLAGLLSAVGAAFALGSPIDAEALFEGRFVKPFDTDREPRFIVNPCELAPQMAADLAPAVQAPRVAEPAASPRGEATPLATVRALVAARAELPIELVGEDSRLLSDLHLNSIAVGQMVGEAARQLGVAPPASPTDYANATVRQVAEALAELQALGLPVERVEGPPAGIDSWVRAFSVEWVPAPAPASAPAAPLTTAEEWTILAPPDHPLAARLSPALAQAGGSGVALCLPVEPGVETIPLLLAAARAVQLPPSSGRLQRPARLLVLQQGGGGGGFARSLHRELPAVATVLLDLPFDHPQAAEWIATEAALASGYREVRYDEAGERRAPVLRLLPEPETLATAPLATASLVRGDVLLATGGGKGITAECARAIALETGARLALVGRATPEADAELAANLERLRAAGIEVGYFVADVTDAAAVRAAVRAAEAQLGPIRGLLHGASRNVPQLLAGLSPQDFEATVAPKVAGLENLLAAIDPAGLRLLVAFGSIIAAIGMPGEADYATANDWLAARVERFAAAHPDCRCLTLDWSVWSGVGMGERLGRIESLLREGVTPIPPDAGVAALLDMLARPTPRRLVVAGRFGEVPTLRVEPRALPFLRFLETPRVFYPGIELVAEVELSAGSDPYLADHVFRGERLFPAVLGLEAMAQAAQAVLGTTALPDFEQVELSRPVVVNERQTVTLRIAALARGHQRVEVALRTSADGFSSDCFRGICSFAEAAPSTRAEGLPHAGEHVSLAPASELYGGLLFHQGRFRRLESYRFLSAHECVADISPDGAATWFSPYLPGELLLGDPGARDAALHGLQPCVPHATILPMGVERIRSGRLRTTEPWSIDARERERLGDVFVYDLDVRDRAGNAVESWEGLRLKAVERLPAPAVWLPPLLGPYLERRLEELLPPWPGRILVERLESAGRKASDHALRRLLGENGTPLHRRPDGKPETRDGSALSLSHAGTLLLAMTGAGVLGCDLEPVAPRSAETWSDLLGAERTRLAEAIAREHGESFDSAATRVWTAIEALRKAVAAYDAPLVLGPRGDGDGWLLLRAGACAVASLVVRVEAEPAPIALALAVGQG